jgi:hypothetical protein
VIVAVDALRRKAKDWELSSLAAQERGDLETAVRSTAIAIVLFEVAEALELESEAA